MILYLKLSTVNSEGLIATTDYVKVGGARCAEKMFRKFHRDAAIHNYCKIYTYAQQSCYSSLSS